MSGIGEAIVAAAAVGLGILCACGLGWLLIAVIAPLGWSWALLFVGLLIVLICLMSINRPEAQC